MTVKCRHVVCHQCECEGCETIRRERDALRATLAELRAHGIDIDNGIWTGRVRLPDGSSPMTDEIEEAFVERDALRAIVQAGLDMLRKDAFVDLDDPEYGDDDQPAKWMREARAALGNDAPKEKEKP